jgi:penicillin-insensitive murein endopeptidase
MTMAPIIDGRDYFVIPQAYEGGGYYVYGSPDKGRAQFAHPRLISLITLIASQWAAIDTRKFGVGNISLANGRLHPPHKSHQNGLQVDIRPLRLDGKCDVCDIKHREYDRAGTAKLINFFQTMPGVNLVLFNDVSIPGVKYAPKHNDHFHIGLKP